ncbi:MAG: DUF3000 family protein [Candidatus Nanopelagicales bacterium]
MQSAASDTFHQAVDLVRTMQLRPEVELAEAPAPRRMAPDAMALTAEVVRDEEELGSGRLVILHNPAGDEGWEGTTRIVLYIDALVEADLAGDSLLPEVGWSWLEESLEEAAAEYWALGGTVTRVQSESFAEMSSRDPEGRVQIRASWTAGDVAELTHHVQAWADLLATACGLEPVAAGVTLLRPH